MCPKPPQRPGSPDPQTQSPLFTHLPAELRNKIYKHAFTTDAFPIDTSPTPTPHALSLLQTCHRIHNEASALAFQTHTFPLLSIEATYLSLRTAASRLHASHLRAIQSLCVPTDRNPGVLLCNSLLLFPRLARFSIYRETAQRQHIGGLQSVDSCADNAREPAVRAVETYVPNALIAVLGSATDGAAYKWQAGERWSVKWPQLGSGYCYTVIKRSGNAAMCPRRNEGGCCEVFEELVMDDEAAGEVEGVQMCGCGCKNVAWTGAVLVQEGGRRVGVGIVFRCAPVVVQPKPVGPKVKLVPGPAPAREVVDERTGFGYEADEEYWEAMRRKNRNLGALCRGLWKTAMAFENKSYSRLMAQKREPTYLV